MVRDPDLWVITLGQLSAPGNTGWCLTGEACAWEANQPWNQTSNSKVIDASTLARELHIALNTSHNVLLVLVGQAVPFCPTPVSGYDDTRHCAAILYCLDATLMR